MQAAAALRGLGVTHSNKMKIVQEGALTPLSRLLSSDDIDILREVRWSTRNAFVLMQLHLFDYSCHSIIMIPAHY